MDINKPMPLLLIEDEVADCIKFKEYVNTRTDVVFVAMTDSASKGLNYVQTLMPEGIIVDIELHKGTGSGLQFLSDLKKSNIALRPILIVATKSPSQVVHNHVRNLGVDLVFCKRQKDYSAEMVIKTIVALRESWFTIQSNELLGDLQEIESPEERRNRIMERINTEMEFVGIGVRYKGYEYLQEAIYNLINKDKNSSEVAINQVAENRKISYNTIIHAMQTAINRAWKISSIEDLQKYYTARVNINTGVPTPVEFIHYYADKIRKTI